MNVPPEAVAAVEQSLAGYLGSYALPPGDIHNAAIIAVRDAAPHIAAGILARVEQGVVDGAAEVIAQAAAAERERCAQLAEQVHAVYAARCDDPGHLRQGRMCAIRVVRLEADGGHKEPFAALLREEEPA